MQTDNPILDDLAKLAGGAAGAVHGMKREIEAAVKTRIERMIADLDLVSREEFEVVRDMARLARQENESLQKKIGQLEARLAENSRPKARQKTKSK